MRQMSLFGHNLSAKDRKLMADIIERQERRLAVYRDAFQSHQHPDGDQNLEKNCLDSIAVVEQNIELLKRLSA